MLESFTAGERKVIMIIAVVIVAAYGVQWIQGYREAPPPIDYSRSDSIFYSRSKSQPYKPAVKILPSTNTKKTAPAGRIALNTASREQLISLPGIGPAMADRIISWRKRHGSFNSIEQLKAVKGIGPKTLKKLIPYISLN